MNSTIPPLGYVALLVFNLPVLAVLVAIPLLANLRQALKEKTPSGNATDATSYSRVTGLVGTVIIVSFYWAIGEVVIVEVISSPATAKLTIEAVIPFFLVGSALFVPYAFNQLRSIAGGLIAGSATAQPAPPPAVQPGASGVAPTRITVANLSSSIDDQTFAAAVAAINMQVSGEFLREWGVSAVLTPVRLALIDGFAPMSQATDAIIYVGDQVTDPIGGPANAYAYHSIIAGQAIPYGFVYRDACDTLKRPWSAALSHEVLEMLVDPQLSCSKIGPAPAGSPDAGQSVSFECEVCDPTEADTYPINGVCVSNFVTKAYFAQAQTGVPTNKLNLPLAPFGVRPGGYVQYQIAGNVRQYPLAAGAQIIARRMLGPWRRNARRADRAALAEVVRSNFAKL